MKNQVVSSPVSGVESFGHINQVGSTYEAWGRRRFSDSPGNKHVLLGVFATEEAARYAIVQAHTTPGGAIRCHDCGGSGSNRAGDECNMCAGNGWIWP